MTLSPSSAIDWTGAVAGAGAVSAGCGATTAAFQEWLKAAGAKVISYVPNNAFLVRASSAVAATIGQAAEVQAVLPFEPYYKLDASLLALAGSIVARFRAAGMVWAMAVAGAAQASIGVAVFALNIASAEPPGAVGLLLLIEFFAGAWFLSAWSFRNAVRS